MGHGKDREEPWSGAYGRPTTGPMPPPGPRKPFDFTRFDRLMAELQEWRSEDHEDNKVLCRSHIIEIIEGVKAMQALAPVRTFPVEPASPAPTKEWKERP